MHKQDNSVKDTGLDTIVESMYEKEEDIDQFNQNEMDKDLLEPLHKAAQAQGADDLNDWITKHIKGQDGEEFVERMLQFINQETKNI